MMARLFAALLLVLLASGAGAVQPDEMLADPALEARARGLSQGLRCLVCQNESIDDSNAGLARDLRLLVREQLLAGKSDEAVIAYVVARYGEYVLLKPPVQPTTWPLWFGPPLILLVAVGAVAWARLRPEAPPAPLSESERRRLEQLLG